MSTDGYFATLMDCAPDALVVFDDRSVISYVNKQSERLFGYHQSELLNGSLTQLIPAGLSLSAPGTVVVDARHKTGGRLPVEVAIARVDRAAGPVYTAAFRSRSQLLHLPDVGRLKSDFLANMSHELRSPLNVIIGFAKLMYRGRVGDVTDPQREYLGDILDSAEQLLELINDLVQLSKLESGWMELQVEPVNLALLLHEVHESVDSLARAKRITLVTDAAPDLEIEIDSDLLRQALINKLLSALRVTSEGGSLQLQARLQDSEHVRVEIVGGEALAAAKPDGGLRSVLTERLVERQGGRTGVCLEPSSMYVLLPRRPLGELNPLPPTGPM